MVKESPGPEPLRALLQPAQVHVAEEGAGEEGEIEVGEEFEGEVGGPFAAGVEAVGGFEASEGCEAVCVRDGVGRVVQRLEASDGLLDGERVLGAECASGGLDERFLDWGG